MSGPDRRRRLRSLVDGMPAAPGVYLFLDERGAVAYVGKARRLRARVRSYFSRSRADGRRASVFFDRYVRDIRFVCTENEHEAFLLESKLVKRHHPPYNVMLRDDKDFPYVRVDGHHPFPALVLARRPRTGDRKVRLLGPFANVGALRATLRMLGGVVPLRDCSDRELASRTRPCLKHEMGRCCAPCVGMVDGEAYGAMVAEAVDALSGRCGPLVERLERAMGAASGEQRYEDAARLRDQIALLRDVSAPQGVANVGLPDADVLGLRRAGDLAQVVVLFFRGDALVSSSSHSLSSRLPDGELLGEFLLRFYAGRPVPPRVLLPLAVPEVGGLQAYLAGRAGRVVRLRVPRRGPGLKALRLAQRNARHGLAMAVEQRGEQRRLLEALRERLALPRLPEVIECYDVSNTGRAATVASRVVFRHGEPDRARYRTYRIRSRSGPDDYGAMGEVLRRRLGRRSTDALPDLILLDGGRQHLAVGEAVLAELGSPPVALAALAKGGRRGRALMLAPGETERVYLVGRAEPCQLDRDTPEEYLLQRIRDEAHRFAIGHHRRARSRDSLASRLDDVPGVGPVLKRRLLTAFGGMRALSRASPEEIASVRQVGPTLAHTIRQHLDGA